MLQRKCQRNGLKKTQAIPRKLFSKRDVLCCHLLFVLRFFSLGFFHTRMFCFAFLFHFHEATCFKCKILSIYSGSEGLEPPSRHLLSWLTYLLPFLSPAIYVSIYCLQLHIDYLFSRPFQIIIHYSSYHIMRLAGCVSCMGRGYVCTRFWWGSLRGKDHFGRPGLRCEANIKMDQGIGKGGT